MLDLEITTHCNLRCRWCFVRQVRPERRHMSVELASRIVAEAAPRYGPGLHLSGGEPLLYPDLRALLVTAARHGFTETLINTNGTLLDRASLAALQSSPLAVELAISVDGRQHDHEHNRGASSHGTVVDAIRRVLDLGIPVRVLSIVTRKSIQRLDGFLDWVADTVPGIRGVHLIPIGDVSRGRRGAETTPLGPADIVDLGLCSAARLLDGQAVRVLDYPLVNLVYRAVGLPVSLVGSRCGACTNRICVQVDGTITPCHPVWASLGSYRPGALLAVRHSPLSTRIAGRRFEGCETCEDRAICGHCRAAVLAATGGLLGNDWLCSSVREEISRRGLRPGFLPERRRPCGAETEGAGHVAV